VRGKMAKKKISIKKHVLLPEHKKLSEADKKKLLEEYHITIKELPKINRSDAAIAEMDVKEGDVIKVTRKSQTAGVALFYRVVISG
jgi:DNA-directed RNA polymerase subunit H